MSEENVQLVRRTLEAFDRRDRAAWLPLQDEDFEAIPIRDWPDWPESEVRGREAAWDFYVEFLDPFERVLIDETEVLDAGADKVLWHPRVDLRGRGSGAGVEFDYWCVATIRQGRVLRAQWFTDRADAFKAAGLSE
jgi:ketosteroid isomerase-like protein